MNKVELIKEVSQKSGITKVDCAKVLDCILESIIASVTEGDSVRLIGFGAFEQVKREPRKARNPKTNEVIMVAAKRVPKFKAGKEFKNAVSGDTICESCYL